MTITKKQYGNMKISIADTIAIRLTAGLMYIGFNLAVVMVVETGFSTTF